jgi:plasmid stabilization system protein ParE
MTYRVVILARARHDVQEKYDWIASASPEGAERWLDRFEQAMETLKTNPNLAPLAPESRSFDIEIRHILFRTRAGRTYRAVFTVVDDEIRILRVRGPGQPPLRLSDISMDG